MKNLSRLLFPLLFVALATPVAGQLFPFDRESDSLLVSQKIVLKILDGHTQIFGKGKIHLEVYFEPWEEVETKPGYAITFKCTETIFVEKMEVAGDTLYPVTDDKGSYLFYFYRDGCYVLTTIERTPDGSTSESNEAWGDCKKTKKI